MKTFLIPLLLLLAFAVPAFAVDTPPDFGPQDADYDAGRKALEAQNWKLALDHFNRFATREPKSADAHNMLGYTYRHAGNMDLAFRHYAEALKLDPDHRGAHEYIGEAYLQAGNLAKADEHLKTLNRLCLATCEEYQDLKRAIDRYKAKK